MSFCIECGAKTVQAIPEGDDKPRTICMACGYIHYENPKVICGALVTWQDKVLLCRRAIEPQYGLWTLPAGYMELNETMQEGAIRETMEEASAKIDVQQLYCLYDIPHIGQIYSLFKAELKDGSFGIGPETLESHLFSEEDIPWDLIAFPSVKQTLIHFFHDRKTHHYPLHLETIQPD